MLVQLLRMLLNRWRRVLCLWLFISNGTPINNSGENISDKLDGNIEYFSHPKYYRMLEPANNFNTYYRCPHLWKFDNVTIDSQTRYVSIPSNVTLLNIVDPISTPTFGSVLMMTVILCLMIGDKLVRTIFRKAVRGKTSYSWLPKQLRSKQDNEHDKRSKAIFSEQIQSFNEDIQGSREQENQTLNILSKLPQPCNKYIEGQVQNEQTFISCKPNVRYVGDNEDQEYGIKLKESNFANNSIISELIDFSIKNIEGMQLKTRSSSKS